MSNVLCGFMAFDEVSEFLFHASSTHHDSRPPG